MISRNKSDFVISQNRFFDIRNTIFLYHKINFSISKNRNDFVISKIRHDFLISHIRFCDITKSFFFFFFFAIKKSII